MSEFPQPNPCGLYECGAPDCGCEGVNDSEPLTPQQVYRLERDKAAERGNKRLLVPRRDREGKTHVTEASDEKIAEAKRLFDKMTKEKTHRRNRHP